jgi:3',5'-cyclic AMP phosphodiesterase CpdA
MRRAPRIGVRPLCLAILPLALALWGCHGEKPDAPPSADCDCSDPSKSNNSAQKPVSGDKSGDADAPDSTHTTPQTQAAAPPQPEPIVEGAKGSGPVATYYPGLSNRPKLSEAHAKALSDALTEAVVKKPPKTAMLGAPGNQTMPEVVPAKKSGTMPRGVPEGYENRHDVRVKIEPYVEILPEGKAKLRWQTWLKTPQTFVHFGVQIPDQLLDYPRYRLGTATETPGETTQHEAILTLTRLEKPIVDVAGFNANSGGTLDYRIELYNPLSKLTQYVEGRFAYTKTLTGEFTAGVAITEGPFVDLPKPDGMTISFETDMPTAAAALVVDPKGRAQVFLSNKSDKHHEISITGLAPDTLYAYRVGAMDARQVLGWSGDFAFRTAPESTRPFRFSVMSDSRAALGGPGANVAASNHEILRAFFTESLKMGADFIIFPGDLVDGYTTQRRDLEMQLEAWKRVVEPIGHYIPIFEGMGNHEFLFTRPEKARLDLPSPNSTEDVFAAEFVNPTNGPPPERSDLPPYLENVYSFDFGKVHFISINTNYWISSSPGESGNREGFIMPSQMAWMEKDLKAARDAGASFIFVFTHEPGFPNGGHRGDAMYWNGKVKSVNEMRTQFWTLMSQYEVDVVFHGDEHNYSRLKVDSQIDPAFKRPIWQVTTGGCGAPYYAQDKTVPWAERVSVFSAQENFVMVDVLDDSRAVLTTFGRNGEVLDRFTVQR